MKYRVSEKTMITKFGDVTYLLNCETEQSIQLMGVANYIIDFLSKKEKTIDQVVENIVKRFKISKEVASKDITNLFENLTLGGFLECV